MKHDDPLLKILACPIDKGPLCLLAPDDALYNPRLRRRYPILDGIPQLLPSSGVQLTDAEHEHVLRQIAEERAGFEGSAGFEADPGWEESTGFEEGAAYDAGAAYGDDGDPEGDSGSEGAPASDGDGDSERDVVRAGHPTDEAAGIGHPEAAAVRGRAGLPPDEHRGQAVRAADGGRPGAPAGTPARTDPAAPAHDNAATPGAPGSSGTPDAPDAPGLTASRTHAVSPGTSPGTSLGTAAPSDPTVPVAPAGASAPVDSEAAS
ncbi:hypothetical protein GCM10010211_22830 [Streptomyces albospinus]|uniref:Uncharacterized protein n=1 Tax=Streptomyces albospinus TaxID=285515 RepID=A0ABQ2UYP0_9ACTN|nr:hypothetical protein GCM10010211_22830 [Streptomyces albospinus]